MIVKPETLIGWHRKGFKLFWKRKSRLGRPRIPVELRQLIDEMVRDNPTWGQARIADELLLNLASRFLPARYEPTGRARCCERLIGTVRRECLDYVIPIDERQVDEHLQAFGLKIRRNRAAI